DRWITARFMQILQTVTHEMDHYELARASRPLREFVDDLSTWWLRRSRDRIKSDNEFERADALRTLREILQEFSKVLAPFIPFLAEKIYLEVGGQKMSVHLEKWPRLESRVLDEKLLGDMKWAREVVSRGHEARAAAKIAVRQALGQLTIRFAKEDEMKRLQKQEDLLLLIGDELNVEALVLEYVPGQTEVWTIELDTTITPELKRKGLRREFMRAVMNLRKEVGLQPHDRITLFISLSAGEARQAIESGQTDLAHEVKASGIEWMDAPTDARGKNEFKLDGQVCTIALK
ncbi:hypothetical protein EXS71_01460, partial [Candidatus Uhrbacteria bacterium]|nr:hypothetical protein [Candidatus Uhrbacteria bacterium]